MVSRRRPRPHRGRSCGRLPPAAVAVTVAVAVAVSVAASACLFAFATAAAAVAAAGTTGAVGGGPPSPPPPPDEAASAAAVAAVLAAGPQPCTTPDCILGPQLVARLAALWTVGSSAAGDLDPAVSGGTDRGYLSPAGTAGAAAVAALMRAAGMEAVRRDAAGNVRGVLPADPAAVAAATAAGSPSPPGGGAWTLLLGSHHDTVPGGGGMDGALGVLVPVAVVQAMAAYSASGGEGGGLPFDIEVVAMDNEEGNHPYGGLTLTGAAAYAGTLNVTATAAVPGFAAAHGVALPDDITTAAMAATTTTLPPAGTPAGVAARLATAARSRWDNVVAWVEVHAEQGPSLERARQPLGVVTAIAGQVRLGVTLEGGGGHAGTVPMVPAKGRADALLAAAAAVVAVERVGATCGAPGGDSGGIAHNAVDRGEEAAAAAAAAATGEWCVATVGRLTVGADGRGGVANAIPRSVTATVDVRAGTSPTLDRMVTAAGNGAWGGAAAARGVRVAVATAHAVPPVALSPWVTNRLAAAVATVTTSAVGRDGAQGACISPTHAADGGDAGILSGGACAAGVHDGSDGGTVSFPHPTPAAAATEAVAGAMAAVPRLTSGAGHDSAVLAAVAPAGMLFVRSVGGVSHTPAEACADDDVAAAAASVMAFVKALAMDMTGGKLTGSWGSRG
ncbi:hypothetical protein MMPV_008483 [Pyropia vietnamensis]